MNVPALPAPATRHPPVEQQAARLYRRVCLLRASGRKSDAERLAAAELAPLLPDGDAAGRLDPGRWEAISAREEDRVADAEAIAELLGPLLEARLPLSPRPRSEAPRAAGAPRLAGAAPAIADLLDEMLGLDRARAPAPPHGFPAPRSTQTRNPS